MPTFEFDGIGHYFEIHGEGPPVVLLHGGFCSVETWRPQVQALSTAYELHLPERPGQGRTPDREAPMTYEGMVRDTVAYLDSADLAAAHVVGFSDGAIAGLLLARDHPERVLSLVSISANLDPAGLIDDDEEQPSTNDGSIEELDVMAAYERLAPKGAPPADDVIEKMAGLWRTQPQIPAASLASIRARTLVLAGQFDSIRTEHTIEIARAIPDAELAIIPGAGHMVSLERPEVVNLLLMDFLASRATG